MVRLKPDATYNAAPRWTWLLAAAAIAGIAVFLLARSGVMRRFLSAPQMATAEPAKHSDVIRRSRSSHNPWLGPSHCGINHACGTFWRDQALVHNLVLPGDFWCWIF